MKIVKNQSYDAIYQLNNINDQYGNPITTLKKFYDLLEDVFKELIENILRLALKTISTYKYVIIGGKALNNIINTKYLPKSFDFNIHLFEGDHNDLLLFGNLIENATNNVITNQFPIYRKYIISILSRYNLITNTEKIHYDTAQLFYFGVTSLFFDFKFRDDLFLNGLKYSNDNGNPNNELFYPISDIKLENELNFGLQIMNQRYIINNYDSLPYATYFVVLYNAIKYSEISSYKQEKLLNKVKHLSEVDKYACYFIKNNTSLRLPNNIQIIGQITNVPSTNIIVNGKKVYDFGRSLKSIIEDFVANYNSNVTLSADECRNRLILDNTTSNQNEIFTNGANVSNFLSQFEKEVYQQDINRNIYYYTGYGYMDIGAYLDYNYYDIDVTTISYQNYRYSNQLINFSDGSSNSFSKEIKVLGTDISDTINNMEYIIRDIESLFPKIRNSGSYLNNLQYLKDEFIVYRLQNFMCFNSPNGDQFNPSVIKTDTIFSIPRFWSTSFKTNFPYDHFVRDNTFLFRILIKKESKNWIFLNRYSEAPTESEILLNRSSYFVVKDVNNFPITISGTYRDLSVITLKLHDSLNDALNDSSHIVELINVNEKNFSSFKKMKSSRSIVDEIRDIEHRKTEIQTRKRRTDEARENKKQYQVCNLLNTILYDPPDKNGSSTLINDCNIYFTIYEYLLSTASLASNVIKQSFNTQILLNYEDNTYRLFSSQQKFVAATEIPYVVPIISYPQQEIIVFGAGNNKYLEKYLKYKTKYLDYKNKLI
ncbi:MAG: hypothetical protein Satyrvirus5_22 [Satyrvirus sp.]|uniref:ADP ribosyltransferase domain-containing protein n=1 Tax=Satyrvirus sp. TaxID=2487771 RepID=A0A3G5ADB7_9VIRU|nr:MAG: hypothetical protein Satyrvirus5_22 [Satyrvirus sp.]